MLTFSVLSITTAYEQGFGQALRDDVRNPYAAASLEAEAWDHGREVGKQKQAAQKPLTKSQFTAAMDDHLPGWDPDDELAVFALVVKDAVERAHGIGIQCAPRAEASQPVAWMDPQTLDVVHAERKRAWMSDYGIGGQTKAQSYTQPLYAAPQAAQPVAQEPTAWLAPNASFGEPGEQRYIVVADDAHPAIRGLVGAFQVYAAPRAEAVMLKDWRSVEVAANTIGFDGEPQEVNEGDLILFARAVITEFCRINGIAMKQGDGNG